MVGFLALMLVLWAAFVLAMLELRLKRPARAIREGPVDTSSNSPAHRAPDAMPTSAYTEGSPRKAWLDDVVRFSHEPVHGRSVRDILTPFDESFGLFSPDDLEHDPLEHFPDET